MDHGNPMRDEHQAQLGPGQLCDICDKLVPFSDILEHLFIHVGPLYLLNCPNPQCPHMFTSYKSLQAHFYAKGNRKRFPICGQMARETKILWTCKSCPFVADTHPNLRKHLEDLHEQDSSKKKKYECPVTGCEEKFRVLQSVNFHLQKHRQPSTDFQDCSICGMNLESEIMEVHLKEGHQVEAIHGCVQCLFKFGNRDDLLKHLNCHLDIGILCNICEDNDQKKKYYSYSLFKQHCYFKHGDPLNKIKCEWCDNKFWRREDAYEHATTKHKDKDAEGLGHWKCEVEGCGRRFKKKSWEFHKNDH